MAKDQITVIGGGIVGLAAAFSLQKVNPRLKVLVLEKESELAKHQTGNNSGVIHSGLYYKPGSMKAHNCIRGYKLLLDFCREHDVAYELCGKIVVATNEAEIPLLKNLFERGSQNGLTGFKMLDKEGLKEYEPHVAGVAGFFVPQTGIIDYKRVAFKLADLIQQRGGQIRFNEKVTDIKLAHGGATVITEKSAYETSLVVNCAGLYSDKVASLSSRNVDIRIIPFRGEYYKLHPSRENLIKNLIYPVPDPNFPFLGVHFTRMMRGGVEAGPNAVLAFSREGYGKSDIDLRELSETLAWPGFQKVARKYWRTGWGEMYRSFSKAAFPKALQKLVPEIQENDLVAGGAGVRAQACDRKGGLVDDFLIIEEQRVEHHRHHDTSQSPKKGRACHARPALQCSQGLGRKHEKLAAEENRMPGKCRSGVQ